MREVVVIDEVAVTVSAPASVIAPAELTLRLPPIVVPARSVAVLFTSVALPVPLGASVTAPVSAAGKSSVIEALPAVVVNDEVPVTVTWPLSVIAPAELTTALPPIVLVPRSSAVVTPPSVALPVPLGARLTAPVWPAGMSSVIAALPAVVVNDEVPVTVSAPASVIAPAELTLRLPPIVVPARSVAVLFTSVALHRKIRRMNSSPLPTSYAAICLATMHAVVVNDEGPVTVTWPRSGIAP